MFLFENGSLISLEIFIVLNSITISAAGSRLWTVWSIGIES